MKNVIILDLDGWDGVMVFNTAKTCFNYLKRNSIEVPSYQTFCKKMNEDYVWGDDKGNSAYKREVRREF